MNRIEQVREKVDELLLNMSDSQMRKEAYVHIYGVSQACGLLALKRDENVELAIVAGMLHDIYLYTKMDPIQHANRGAEMSRSILNSLEVFNEEEIDAICTAINHHSDKSIKHGDLDEILKDADVMQHALYNPLFKVKQQEQIRFASLKEELCLE